jgi:hypothetical protein
MKDSKTHEESAQSITIISSGLLFIILGTSTSVGWPFILGGVLFLIAATSL